MSMEMKIGKLAPAEGAVTSSKRLGRGVGSGLGKTSGKGHKGQWARSGGGVRPGFEGGQMPIARRVPKRGFNNKFRKEYVIVNVEALNELPANTVVDFGFVMENGLAKSVKNPVGLKVLGNGTLNVALTVKAQKFSESAKAAIEAAGGTAEVE